MLISTMPAPTVRATAVPNTNAATKLKNAADDFHDEALRRLFEEERDAITLIKWKEVLDLLEQATDRCEDCANVLESVVVKHG